MPTPPIEVAIAILYQDGQFLMQLRDDIPTIVYPGHWSFFGGHLEPGESADAAVVRELQEEIAYTAVQLKLFDRRVNSHVIRNIYYGPLSAAVDDLSLNEGQDLGLCSVADVERGYRYSARLAEDRPLGRPHQQILLDFVAQFQGEF
ncbi:MAG: NUDIX domain-containing protein [Leptolyngbyaceae cyanobacterium SM1_1_3]|nr:NUDIX domain-containing protein [Leptolyngbyaceae cyanobacterium SM1_1_3]NJN01117.1 NUDIX domain-containing protein [Leptolyngbyaceae cyanobacterium RM1_1_2]NJO10048.1 NUDIX domain-containing protein [Leptolyngbyaceae cyanobacterium SL_1_1]